MSGPELIARLADERLDDAFAEYCAETFSSYSYAPGVEAHARMHAHWLRRYVSSLEGDEPCGDASPLWETCMEVGDEALAESGSAGEFCRLFVRKWCARFAEG